MNIALEFVRHPRARRYVIRVRPDGTVRVTLPRWGSRREAEIFAQQQQGWIDRQRRRVAERQPLPAAAQSDAELHALKARAVKELPDALLRLAATHGLSVSKISVRNQRWRWGSCSPKGHICLNWRLILMPEPVREYVLIHELMHLRRLDHSPTFWRFVAAACPGYQDARKWLRANGQLLNHPING
jgi:predicted metal-dependent hydrolase